MNTHPNTSCLTIKLTADDPAQWRKSVVDLARAVGAENVMHVRHRTDYREGYFHVRPGNETRSETARSILH